MSKKWSDYSYLVLMPDEDGEPVSFFTEDELDDLLNGEGYGEVNVLSKEDVEKKGFNPNSGDWSYYSPALDVLIFKLPEPLKVRAVVRKWEGIT